MRLKKKALAGTMVLFMLAFSSMSAFAAEEKGSTSELDKVQNVDMSELSNTEGSVQSDSVIDAEPFVLPMEQNNMRMVGVEASPIAYNPTTGEAGVFNNYKQTFTNSDMGSYNWGYVYADEMKTIKDFYASFGYEIIGWRTVSSYYFKMDRPVDYYYSCNGSPEQRVPLSINDNMILYQCTFDKLLAAGEGDGFYTTEFKGRFGHRIDNGGTVYATFSNGISFNVGIK